MQIPAMLWIGRNTKRYRGLELFSSGNDFSLLDKRADALANGFHVFNPDLRQNKKCVLFVAANQVRCPDIVLQNPADTHQDVVCRRRSMETFDVFDIV